MGQATPLVYREQIAALQQAGLNYQKISESLSLPYSTVRGICKAIERSASNDPRPRYHQCGRVLRPSTAVWQRRAKWLKRLHPDWGAPFIRMKLVGKYNTDHVPHERSIQRWFKASGLNRPREQGVRPGIARATAVHKVWQVDAKERFHLPDGSPCCYLNIVDEYSGGCIDARLFPLSPHQPSSYT